MADEPRINLSPPELLGDERERVLAALETGWVAPVGPDLDAFEAELAAATATAHAVGTASGTGSLHLVLHALGVGPGDEVLVSTFTFVASANAVVYTGATPVFVDSDRASWCMDPDLLAGELERRARTGRLPKAVVVVDLYGQCADYGRIVPLCERYGVPLVEDAAEALGATCGGRPAGSFGVAGVLSFNGNKLITTSGGGAVVTNDEDLARRIRYLATQARQPVVHYEHTELGFNYRLSNVLAALGRGQLAVLPMKLAARRAVREWYGSLFADVPGVAFMPEAPYGEPNRWLTCITVDPGLAGFKAADLMAALDARNVESRPTWKPMHLQPQFERADVIGGDVSTELFERGLCLPSGMSAMHFGKDRIEDAIERVTGRGWPK